MQYAKLIYFNVCMYIISILNGYLFIRKIIIKNIVNKTISKLTKSI